MISLVFLHTKKPGSRLPGSLCISVDISMVFKYLKKMAKILAKIVRPLLFFSR
ncbi:hypothetical protein IGI50_000291 [Enterococcus sp. DIV0170]